MTNRAHRVPAPLRPSPAAGAAARLGLWLLLAAGGCGGPADGAVPDAAAGPDGGAASDAGADARAAGPASCPAPGLDGTRVTTIPNEWRSMYELAADESHAYVVFRTGEPQTATLWRAPLAGGRPDVLVAMSNVISGLLVGPRDLLFAENEGLVRLPKRGGDRQLLSRSGFSPAFHRGRPYWLEGEWDSAGEPAPHVSVVRLGADERTPEKVGQLDWPELREPTRRIWPQLLSHAGQLFVVKPGTTEAAPEVRAALEEVGGAASIVTGDRLSPARATLEGPIVWEDGWPKAVLLRAAPGAPIERLASESGRGIVDGDHVYWSGDGRRGIFRRRIAGGPVSVVTCAYGGWQFVLDTEKVYWFSPRRRDGGEFPITDQELFTIEKGGR